MKWTPEAAARGAIEGKYTAARRGVGGVDGLLAGHPAGLVDAARVLLAEVIHSEK
jgi:hypothetical protein